MPSAVAMATAFCGCGAESPGRQDGGAKMVYQHARTEARHAGESQGGLHENCCAR